jgi:tripartite-type tricarboxylate transporter receptor subunit TctC
MKSQDLIDRHKLTRKYFLGLPTGVYLVSNCYKRVAPNKSTPIFYEYVEQLAQRISQWERVKAAGADQRLCDVYRSSEEFKKAVEYKTAAYGNYPGIVIFEVDKK